VTVPWRGEDSQPVAETVQEPGRRAAVMRAALAKQARHVLEWAGPSRTALEPGQEAPAASAESVLAPSRR